MHNLKLPASPTLLYDETSGKPNGHRSGFTKLELASLMIAQSIAIDFTPNQDEYLSERCVEIAKAVLEEANK
jgi:hypothetical protein